MVHESPSAMCPRDLIADYERLYREAAFIPQHLDSEETGRFADLLPQAGPKLRVLDMGAAEGVLAVLLAQRGHHVTAADIAPTYLEKTASLAEKSGLRVKTVLCDIEKGIDCFGGELFDAIYFMDIIEHLRSPSAGIVNLAQLLSQDGLLIINTPNLCALSRTYRYTKQGRRRNNFFDPAVLGDFHLQGYDYATLEKLLNFCGLRTVEIVPNTIALPVIHRFWIFGPLQRRLSRMFPFLSDHLLVKCRKCPPIDAARQLEYWKRTFGDS